MNNTPLQFQNRRSARWFHHPRADYFLKRYAHHATTTTTVCDLIAQRYAQEYGFTPSIIMNAPRLEADIQFRGTNPKQIHLVHHGIAAPDRPIGADD